MGVKGGGGGETETDPNTDRHRQAEKLRDRDCTPADQQRRPVRLRDRLHSST